MITDDIRKIHHILQRLGLGESEVDIFLLGLQHGALTISQLSEISKKGRITVHEIVARLIKKWLYLQTYSGKKRLVYPNNIDAIDHLIESHRAHLSQLEKDADTATSLLRSIQYQSEHFPRIRFYKGLEGITRVLNEIKQDANNISIMSDGQHFYELIDNNFLEQTLDLRRKKNINVRMIFPSGFEYFTYTQWTYQQELQIRSLPHQEQLHGGMIIRWEKVATHYYNQWFITTTIMDDSRTAQMQQYLFERTRESAKQY